ncbi:MAG: hypothetical protein RIT40_62 [Planctomycetota bacterium]
MALVDMKLLLARAANLAPLPDAARRALELSREPDTTPSDIVAAVKTDPVTTARILKLANSAVYGRAEPVGSIEEAGVQLGVQKLVDLVLTTVASRWFETAPMSASERQAAWQRASASAAAASILARLHGQASPERAYTAALLADFGALVMTTEWLEERETLMELLAQGARPDEAERAVLGVDHATLGALVLARYSVPPALVDAVRHHHHPREARYEPALVWTVYLGHQVAETLLVQKTGQAPVGHAETLQFDAEELAELGLDLASVVGLEELLARELGHAS